MTKIIKQLSKDNPKFDEDWLLVSSWKYGIGKYGNVSYWMDHIDIIMHRKDSIKNELSYGKYGSVSILGIEY